MTNAETGRKEALTGTADERIRQLEKLATSAELDAERLRRQLDGALLAWANDETELDINRESRTDY